ncbi:MAG: non-canonical purine NTP diphosphatase [Phaeodactylibacter xiamenensis]|uniref:dITP/XTP pyrophosphatase n=1 Tax=Phaeodactylibacter xiamenensis TaxID=1524460 RepID=A0A098RZC8_9BACT|nr:non-canonical purine NTP diphosphatase [Phaeodactylibacter xiamenensis]KGE85245.1 deoxyribonucleotide triphosphate pyrophosphatase [Phaeodactylibacter xiamenensis]MCR9054330.1 non-canonical purine NTP diphosphatase [bacterium]
MQSIVFATGNPNKISEVSQLLEGKIEIRGLKDIGCDEVLPETSPTIAANASEKAWYVHNNYKVDCFSEDTGLEVDALNGEPGVYSARYAGPAHDDEANMSLLLANMKGEEDRRARFHTVISLIIDGKEHQFEGTVEGQIIHHKKGNQGFGYDPVFMPDGFNRTFAQMSAEEKSSISHRGQAVRKLVAFLKTKV